MIGLHHSCVGESHKATNKPCQDFSYLEIGDNLSLAIVCDGHGGERYFRSDVGAQIATEVTVELVKQFNEQLGESLFPGKPLTEKYARTTEAENPALITKENAVDKAFHQLFSSIIYNWHERILQHAEQNMASEWELQNVQPQYLDDLLNKRDLEKLYGCTLMCYVQAPNYWFAFHLGDGKCFAFAADGTWREPIPWDDRCFLNKTTSICDSQAIDEFRYSYCGDGTFPMAVFLGSDGIDDSFGADENMVNFYVQILKLFATKPIEDVQSNIEETLPELSRIGSQDDMSIACIINEDHLQEGVKHLTHWQLNRLAEQIVTFNEKIVKLRADIASFEQIEQLSQKEMIDYQYAKKELERAEDAKQNSINKWNKIAQEFTPETFVPYNDEIG